MRKCITILLITICMLNKGKSQNAFVKGGNRICGNEYAQFGMNGQSLSALIDFMGNTHNKFLDKVYERLDKEPSLFYSKNLMSEINKVGKVFFSQFGITSSSQLLSQTIELSLDNEFETDSSLSIIANSLLTRLKLMQRHYEDYTKETIIDSLTTIKEEALLLTSFNEAIIVGFAAHQFLTSYNYWNTNLNKWEQLFERCGNTINNELNTERSKPCEVSGKKVVGADAVGALSGAAAGSVGGPVTAVAAGLLHSSFSSCSKAMMEAAKCNDGWVGKAARWLDSWF